MTKAFGGARVWNIAPLAIPICGAFIVYIVARVLYSAMPDHRHDSRNPVLAAITAACFALSLGTLPILNSGPTTMQTELSGVALHADPGALVVTGTTFGLGIIVAVYSGRYLTLDKRYELFYPLLLLMAAGIVGTTMTADLFSLYLFCELTGVTAYALVAFRRHTDTAIEAGFKYLIMGSVGTMIVLLGISFVYRETGSLAMPAPEPGIGPWTRAGLACFLVGLGLKSAIVPLHTWLPDAHGRAPSSISAMLSGVVIQSTLYALLKVTLGLGLGARTLGTLLIVSSWFNMIVGNSMALMQTNVKRLLAYSSIAQVGYIMFGIGVGLHAALPEVIQAGFFLLLVHAACKGLAFLCKGVSHFYCGTTTIAQLRGTARRLPQMAAAMSIALGGMAAMPPLAGFVAKWFILSGAVRAGGWLPAVGAAILILNSLIALAYYLPLVAVLFISPPHPMGEDKPVRVSLWMSLPLLVLSGLTVAIGLYPAPWLKAMDGVGTYLLSLGR